MIADYLALHPQVATQTVDGLKVMVLSDSGEVLVLNATGTRIVELIDSKHSVTEVSHAIEDDYPESAADVRRDLESFLQILLDAGALVDVAPSGTSVAESSS
jgi:hypothetical protein